MKWKRQSEVELSEMPADLWPDYDQWGSPEEEERRARRSDWLRTHDLAGEFFEVWEPAHLAERRRLAGMGPRPPARRKGPLPESVRRLLADLDIDEKPGVADDAQPNQEVHK